MTLVEFEKEHPIIANELRMMSGDHHTGRDLPRWRLRYPDANEVTGVYSVYEEGVLTWYAIVQSPHGEDMAVYKDGKWAYTHDFWMF